MDRLKETAATQKRKRIHDTTSPFLCQYLVNWIVISYIELMNAVGLTLSFFFIIALLLVGWFFYRCKFFSKESWRKFIHIGVSSWWFILIFTIDNLFFALIGPVLFVVVNSVFVTKGWVDLIGIGDKKRNLGLIYFPITLVIMVFLGYSNLVPLWACGIGWFAMGYGDGLAALFGRKYGKRKFFRDKTVLGSSMMFVSTFCVVALFTHFYKLGSSFSLITVTIAVVATAVEAITPWNLDNLTVPFVTMATGWFLLGSL
jgi:phytol kinase